MTDSTAVQPSPIKPLGLAARFFGILTSPRDTYTAIAAAPRWIGMALLVVLVTMACQMWFQSTDVGRQATLDESVRRVESFGVKVSDQMYEGMRKGIMEPSTVSRVISIVSMLAIPPIIWAVIAGILFLVFGVFTGGSATFKQVYTVVVHSGVVGAVGTVFVTPLNYFRQTLSSATNLGVFLPFLPEGSFFARLAGMVDLFLIWWLAILSIGVAVTYKKKTGGVAMVIFGVYAVIALGFAAFMAARS